MKHDVWSKFKFDLKIIRVIDWIGPGFEMMTCFGYSETTKKSKTIVTNKERSLIG